MPDAVEMPRDRTRPRPRRSPRTLGSSESVGRRLVAWAAGTTFLVLVVLAVALYVSVSSTLEASGIRQLDLRVDTLRGLVEGPGPGPTPRAGRSPDGLHLRRRQLRHVRARPRRERPRPRAREARPPRRACRTPASLAAAVGRAVGTSASAPLAETPVRILTRRGRAAGSATVYVQVYQDRTAEQRTLEGLLAVLLAGGAVVVLVAVGFGTVYSRRALVPIRDSLAAQRRALRRQREFAADASHELRTPITVIRASVEHLRRHRDEPVATVGDALDDIGAEVDHLTRLVDELLLLARSDSGAVALERLPVDLGDVAADAASSLVRAGSRAGCRRQRGSRAGGRHRRRGSAPAARPDPRRQRDRPQPA